LAPPPTIAHSPSTSDFHLPLAASPFDRRPAQSRHAQEIRPAFEWSTLGGSFALLILGGLVMLAVYAFAARTGSVPSVGPVRVSGIGNLLASLGILRGAWVVLRWRMQ